jgi:hypothetical protein
MRKTTLTIAFALGFAASLAGACDDQERVRVEERMCERFDECNYLGAGIAVDDCIDDRIMCTDQLVGSQYEDWKADLEDCLSRSNCENYLSCWEQVPSC